MKSKPIDDRRQHVAVTLIAIGLAFVPVLGCRGADRGARANPLAQVPARPEPPATPPTRQTHTDAATVESLSDAEYQRVKARFEDPRHRALLGQSCWSAMHMGEEPMIQMVKALFVKLAGSGEFDVEASVRDAGGIEAYKERIASFLTSSDVMARGVASLVMGIVGDAKYTDRLVALMRSNGLHVHLDMLEGYDRGSAMVALAFLGAERYRAEIALHKSSKLKYVSEGAEAALTLMDAKDDWRDAQ